VGLVLAFGAAPSSWPSSFPTSPRRSDRPQRWSRRGRVLRRSDGCGARRADRRRSDHRRVRDRRQVQRLGVERRRLAKRGGPGLLGQAVRPELPRLTPVLRPVRRSWYTFWDIFWNRLQRQPSRTCRPFLAPPAGFEPAICGLENCHCRSFWLVRATFGGVGRACAGSYLPSWGHVSGHGFGSPAIARGERVARPASGPCFSSASQVAAVRSNPTRKRLIYGRGAPPHVWRTTATAA
jgi:hypothetical protein